MRQFIRKLFVVILLFIGVNAVLLFAIPRDNNSYYSAYLDKIKLLETVDTPRIIFVGGSNVAFGIDSQQLQDSLGRNVINFGLHAGIGIKYPVEDCLQYVRAGDTIILEFETPNFYGSSCGSLDVFPSFIYTVGWRNLDKLGIDYYKHILGLPKVSMSNLIRFTKFALGGSINTECQSLKFEYTRRGFNEFGDEVSHFNYPNKFVNSLPKRTRNIDCDFIGWLKRIIDQYEKSGVKVIILPPICTLSYFELEYDSNIKSSLESIQHPYMVPPLVMTVDDSCMFNSPHHINKDGVYQSTCKLIEILKSRESLL